MFLLLAKSGGDRSVTESLQSGLFLNLVQTYSFYLVPGAVLSIQSHVLLLSLLTDVAKDNA